MFIINSKVIALLIANIFQNIFTRVTDDLSKCSSSNLTNYEKYIEGCMDPSAKFIDVMKSRNNRRFEIKLEHKFIFYACMYKYI
jgi:hypothetical protein